MKKLIVGALASLVLAVSAMAFQAVAGSQEKVINLKGMDGNFYPIVSVAGGVAEDSSYTRALIKIQGLFGLDYATNLFKMRVETASKGTNHNYHYLTQGYVNLTMLQAEKVAEILANGNPRGYTFIKLTRPEHVQLYMLDDGRDDGYLQSLHKKNGSKEKVAPVIFAGRDGSGARLTAAKLKQLEEDYKFTVLTGAAAAKYDYDETALIALSNGDIDGILKVSAFTKGKDQFGNKVLGMSNIDVVDLEDSALNEDLKIGNKVVQLYTFDNDFNLSGKLTESDVETLQVYPYLVIDSKNMSATHYKKILSIMTQLKNNPFK